MYQAKTIQEAGRKWWNDAIPDIAFIARYLGIPFSPRNDWSESSYEVGRFNNRGERDLIAFKPLTTIKIKRSMSDPRPVGEQKNELALINCVDNSQGSSTIQAALDWHKSEELALESVTSETHGWSTSVEIGFEAGNENAKVFGSICLSASGEYSKSKAESKSSMIEGGGTIQVDVKPGEIARLVQTVRSGEVEVDVTDEIVLDLGWRIADWKKRTNGMLDGHSGYARKGSSRSRWHWECLSANDFRSMIEGSNPRYPNLNHKYLRDKCWFEIDRLLHGARRTIVVKSKAKFKRGLWGDARVESES